MAFAPTANRALAAALVVFLWGLLAFASTRGPFTWLASILLSGFLGVVGFELYYWLLRGLGRAGYRLAPRHAVLGGVLLVFTCCCGAGFWALFQDQILISLVAAGGYWLARPAVLSFARQRAGAPIGTLTGPPGYQLDAEGVSLDLGVRWPDDPARGSSVRLAFSELDQVRLFQQESELDLTFPLIGAATVRSADTSLASGLLGLRRRNELAYYLLGETQRPRIWAHLEGAGSGVFFKGPDLIYAIRFPDGRGADIADRFQAYRVQHPGAAVAAPVPSGGSSAFAIFPAGVQANTGNVTGVTIACLLLLVGGLLLAVLSVTTFVSS